MAAEKIAIVTDSTSDLPTHIADQHQIQVIPAILVLNGKTYLDGEGLTRTEFYTRLPSLVEPPTTAAPSVGVFQEMYEKLLHLGYTQIVSIHLSSLLSGIFASAKIAAEPFFEKVKVVDSGMLSMGLGFQALMAAQVASQGANLAQVLDQVAVTRQNLRLVAMLDSLEYLRRSGRVSFLRASVGAMLRLRLFLEVKDGQILRLGQERTRSRSIEKLGEILTSAGQPRHFAMLHTNAIDDAQAFLQRYLPHLVNRSYLVNVTTVIGTHVGPNALGFAAIV